MKKTFKINSIELPTNLEGEFPFSEYENKAAELQAWLNTQSVGKAVILVFEDGKLADMQSFWSEEYKRKFEHWY